MKLTSMNLELTTACPLRCSQCYCNLDNPKHMPLETAKKWLDEGAKAGVQYVSLSGGETLCYPHLDEVIRYARSLGLWTAAAFSGWGMTEAVLDRLRAAGLSQLHISLNGSTEEINALTRQGYGHAIAALRLLRDHPVGTVGINWVMHANNADDFPAMLDLADEYGAAILDVIAFKPDARAQMKSVPTGDQLRRVADVIRHKKNAVRVGVERCYSPLLALLLQTELFGNLNVGPQRGCGAGVDVFSVNLDGSLSPCRHIHYRERFDSLEDYYARSGVIAKLHACTPKEAEQPCAGCRFLYHCRPCLSVQTELHDRIAYGNPLCPLAEKSKAV